MRRHCSKPLQETAHKIWLILKPKTYCFSPSLDIYWQDSSNPQGLHRQNPAKNSNTLERLSKKKHILPKTKLNLHILSFRQTDRHLGVVFVLDSHRSSPKAGQIQNYKNLLLAGRPACSSGNFPPFHNFQNPVCELPSEWCTQGGGRFKVEKLNLLCINPSKNFTTPPTFKHFLKENSGDDASWSTIFQTWAKLITSGRIWNILLFSFEAKSNR